MLFGEIMIIAPLLVKIYEGDQLSHTEQNAVQQTLVAHNVSLYEAVSLNIWSDNSHVIQEQIRHGNTHRYVSHTLDTLANQLCHKKHNDADIKSVLDALQDMCYQNQALPELYAIGRKIAVPGSTASVLSAIRKIHIAIHAKAIAAHIYKAIQKNSLLHDIIVYRAIHGHTIVPSVVNYGFVSTALTKETSFIKYPGYNMLFELKVPAGMHCIDVTPFSNYDIVESEILLPPNVIEITDSYTNGVYTQLNGIVHEIEEFA